MEHHREDYTLSADKRLCGKLDLKGRARAMRHPPTAAEEALWQALRGGQLGARFRRQHPLDRYIVDFVCIDARLVVEVDGGSHLNAEQRDYDAGRSAMLAEMGFRVFRFSNERVLMDLAIIPAQLKAALQAA